MLKFRFQYVDNHISKIRENDLSYKKMGILEYVQGIIV